MPRILPSLSLLVVLALAGCEPLPKPAENASSASSAPSAAESGKPKLEIVDTGVGTGPAAKKGSAVTVHYVGTLVDGKQFDSSVDRGKPFSFIIGQSAVIQGWHQGLVGMRVGGKRKLTIPPDLGYGDAGSPPNIPPRATLLFDIELLHVVE